MSAVAAQSEQTLHALFSPRHVAVVGASETSRAGRQAFENFARLGFSGEVFPVNPRYGTLFGQECFPSLKELPLVPDAIIIALGAERAVPYVHQAAELGVKFAVIFDGGFAEAGPIGVQWQLDIQKACADSGLRLLGPNCQGAISFVDRSALYLQIVREYEPGHVALISQSGMITDSLVTNPRGVRWSHVVSCGNEANIDAADLLEYLVEQPTVDVICMFLETIRDPAKFFEHCDRAMSLGKPVIVLKTGRTEASQAAALAHTGVLGSPDRLVDAAFKAHGVIRTDSLEELLSTAAVMQSNRAPHGCRASAITGSGGTIELVLDVAAESSDIEFPSFSADAVEQLVPHLHGNLQARNPLDFWPHPNLEEAYPGMIGAMASDSQIDMVIGVINSRWAPTGREYGGMSEVEALQDLARQTTKTVVILDMVEGNTSADIIASSQAADVIVLSGIRTSLVALSHAVWWNSLSTRSQKRARSSDAPLALPSSAESGAVALAAIAALGIPAVESVSASSLTEVADFAKGVTYPVVLKIGDGEVLHKTERDGVVLGIADAEQLLKHAERLFADGAQVVLIQQQLKAQAEMILGVQSDPALGLFLLVGMGGVWAEILDDVVIRPVGLAPGDAEQMIRGLRGFSSLNGARGRALLPWEQCVEILERLDAGVRDLEGQLAAIDINPVILTAHEAVVVDSVIVPNIPTNPKK